MLELSGSDLSGLQAAEAVRHQRTIVLDSRQLERVASARNLVERLLQRGKPIYGINTGFGKLADSPIAPGDVVELQRNLILSHSCGTGPPLAAEIVQAMMILRANALMKGHSGIRPQVIELLAELVNRGVTPYVPAQGSVGASGDLVPLAHISSTLLGEGQAYYRRELLPSGEALQRAGLSPVVLQAKEGLALINGTQYMTAHGVLALYDGNILLKSVDAISALTMEALEGIPDCLDQRVHQVRPHRGQNQTASNLRRILAGSALVHREAREKIQDAYSLRCIPQVHGASRDAYHYVRQTIDVEINSVTDNPILFPEDEEVISAGNFHGQPVALVLDFFGLALAELGNISERRVERLVNPQLSGLPPFLSAVSGLNSGYMIAQYTAAALVSENKVLVHPASADSIPTSGNQEDHVSMGSIAGRKLHQILANVQNVAAIELLCACQALEFKDRGKLAAGSRAVYELVRESVPPLGSDRFLQPEMAQVKDLIVSGKVLEKVENIVGELE